LRRQVGRAKGNSGLAPRPPARSPWWSMFLGRRRSHSRERAAWS